MRLALLLGLAWTAAGVSVDFSDKEWKERPVTKVVNLLKDMSAELEAESEKDGEMYDKLACWCETNDKEKTKAIADAEVRIADLSSAIEEYTGKAGTLKVEIEKLESSIKEATEGLAKATEIREKESAEFIAEEKDMIQSTTSLKGAIVTMSKHNAAAALPQEVLLMVKQHLRRHRHVLPLTSRKRALSLIQQPQSGAIFGILKQMKETFEKNLDTSKKDEADAQAEYAELKSGKENEINAATKMADTKTAELADATEKSASSKEDLKDTRGQLASDSEFLANLKTKCAKMDAEFEERSKTRRDEITAVSETIGILTDDDAHDMFSKSLGFLQTTRSSSSANRAATVLKVAGKKVSNPKLIMLATQVRETPTGGGIEAVKANVEKMIADLKQQKTDESNERDACKDEFFQNEKDTAEATHESEDLSMQVEDLKTAIGNENDEIAAAKAEIADMQVEMKRASETREVENKEFQESVADQRATQTILAKALDRLRAFYAKKGFIQVRAGRRQSPPGEFGEYKKSGGAGGVMAMIENIVNDSKRVEQEALQAEQDAQAGYETFISDSNKSITSLSESIMNKEQNVSRNDAARIQAEADLKASNDNLESLSELNRGLHNKCDFLVKNFDLRQSSLSQEIEALQQSTAILSGAK